MTWVSTLGASSLPFLAPEGHRGDAVGARSDCLRLGCVLFQALAGRPPFAHNTDIEIIRAHLAYPPPALSATCDDVPAALDAVVSRALSKRPEDRHATAGELAAAAAAALHRRARQGSPTLPAQPAFTRRPAGRSHGRSRGAPGASPGPCWLLRSLAALPPPRS
jgi:serine/threonine-protein kinase